MQQKSDMNTRPVSEGFDLEQFLPYLLNQAAEITSRNFHATYREDYGITRPQWRVLANLGKFGRMTARDICRISHIEKTKVSRAVAALEAGGFLSREVNPQDRRAGILSLTDKGAEIYSKLGRRAISYDQTLRSRLGSDLAGQLDAMLKALIAQGTGVAEDD